METKSNRAGLIELARKCDKEIEDIKREAKEEEERVMGERFDSKHMVHINIITTTEMKAHAKEMRSEIDRKFVECLMATGTTRAEALRLVRIWNARE